MMIFEWEENWLRANGNELEATTNKGTLTVAGSTNDATAPWKGWLATGAQAGEETQREIERRSNLEDNEFTTECDEDWAGFDNLAWRLAHC